MKTAVQFKQVKRLYKSLGSIQSKMHCPNCGNKVGEVAKFCPNCGTPVEAQNFSAPIEYYAISPKRLALFSLLSFGLFQFYWFFKNWQAVQKFQERRISPFWRAVFTIFFCHQMFRKVSDSAAEHSNRNHFSPGWLAAAYVLLFLASSGLSEIDANDTGLNLLWLGVVASTVIPLLPVQKAINFHNEKISGEFKLEKSFTVLEVALIVAGVLWTILVLWVTFLP